MKSEKTFIGIIIFLFLLWGITLTGLAVQTHRLDASVAANGQYREQLQCYQDREREIKSSIYRTERAIAEGVGGLRNLRETLEIVEKNYAGMWYLLYNNDGDVNNTGEELTK